MAKPVYNGAWASVRRMVLARDRWLCQMRGAGCTGHATEVDHIVPVAQGGSWYDLRNLRAACATCNRSAGAMARQGRVPVVYKPSRQW
jgi:5-methylcytosine-specific restriction protein A